MDFIAPVKTAYFPDRRTRNAGVLTRRDDFASALNSVERYEPVTQRPSAPIVNMAMLLEILSDAGEPVNSNDGRPARKPTAAEQRASLAYTRGERVRHAVDTVVTTN